MDASASVLREQLLWPLMDGQALNAAQDRLAALVLFDPSREIDSLLELAVAIDVGEAHPGHLALLASRLLELRSHNATEREHERTATGVADRLAAERHASEVAGDVDGVKAIASNLRAPLGVLLELVPAESIPAVVRAAARVSVAIAAVSRDRLRSSSLRHELGAGKHQVLEQLLEHDMEVSSS